MNPLWGLLVVVLVGGFIFSIDSDAIAIDDILGDLNKVYCRINGNCQLNNLVVTGNLTFQNRIVNVTVTNHNVTGELIVDGALNVKELIANNTLYVNGSRVGIGTSSGYAPFVVQKGSYQAGTALVSYTGAAQFLNFEEGGTRQLGTFIWVEANSTSADTTAYRAIEGDAIISPGSSSKYTGELTALNFNTLFRGGGYIDEVYGNRIYAGTQRSGGGGNGTIKNLYGYYSGVGAFGAGVTGIINNSYAMYIDDAFNQGTTSIYNQYGLYIAPQTKSNRTYAIYSVGNRSYFGDKIGIGQLVATVPLHVGSGAESNSVDAQILIARDVNNSKTGNGHAFSDSSNVTRSGSIGYNSFDARIDIAGTSDYDHYAAFQAAPAYASSGTLDDYYGLFSTIAINDGDVTNSYAVYADNPTGSGTLTNSYGFYSEALTKGANNFAIYTAGDTKSYFGGNVGIGNKIPNASLHVSGDVRADSFIGDGSLLTGIAASAEPDDTMTWNLLPHKKIEFEVPENINIDMEVKYSNQYFGAVVT